MQKSICLYNFQVKNVGTTSLDLFIDGEIVTAETEDIYKEYWNDTTSISFRTIRNTILQNNPSIVNIYINSPGGNVTEAMATHDFIVELQNKGVIVNGYGYGIIASSSTYILSACKNSYISKNSFYMIHNLSGGVWGTIKDIKNYYETMVTFDNLVKDFYSNLTGKPKDQITQWMDSETYFNGTDAVNYGFVKNLTQDVEFKNTLKSENFQFKNSEVVAMYNSLVKPQNIDLSADDTMFLNNVIANFNSSIVLAKNILNTTKSSFVQSLAGGIIEDNTDDIEDVQEYLTGGVENSKKIKINNKKVNSMNLVDLIVNAFKKEGFVQNKEGEPTKPLTAEALTNALTESLKDFKPEPTEEQLTNSIANFFKDGLPEAIKNQLTQGVTDAVANVVKDLPTNEKLTTLENDIKDLQNDIVNSKGGAKPQNKGGATDEKYNHEGVSFGN